MDMREDMDIRMPDRQVDVKMEVVRDAGEIIERVERDKLPDDKKEENIRMACEKNMDSIRESGFSKELLNDIKSHPDNVLIDIRTDRDLLEYAKDNFSKEANENLKELLKDDSRDRSVLNTSKDYALYSKIQEASRDNINVSRNYDSKSMKRDVREYVNKINDLKVRDNLDRNIEINRHNKIDKSILLDTRSQEERYIPNREIIEKTYETRTVSDKYKGDRDLLEKWNIDKDLDRDRERAEALEKTIKDINLSPVVENYLMSMDKDETKSLMSEMNTRDDYEKFIDKVVNSVREEDRVEFKEELHKNEVEKMASWTKDERDVGLAKEIHVKTFENAMSDARDRAQEIDRNTMLFREVEKDLSKIADMDKDGRYIFPNKNDNITARIDNIDKVKSVAAINLAMMTRDEEDSKRFIANNIDTKIDFKNPERTEDLIKSIAEDVRQDRYQEALNKETLLNGDRIYTENVRLTENKSNDIKDEKDIEWNRDRMRAAEIREEDKLHKGDLNSLSNIRDIREKTVTSIEKDAFKDLPKNVDEKTKTEIYIDKLSEQKAIVAKFSNPIIERELTNGKGVSRFGEEIERTAQNYYEVMKFSDSRELKDNIKNVLNDSRNSQDKEERKLAQCYDFKDRISKAYIRGNLESIEADVRRDIGDIKPEYGQMLYKDGMDKNDVEKTVRTLVTERATVEPNLKDEKLSILLTETKNNDVTKRLEEHMGRELNKTDIKIQGHLASMRMQEIVDRTAYALRSDNKAQANRDVNDFLKDTVAQSKIDGDSKILRSFADEKYETLKYNTFVIGDLNGMSDKMFDYFNSSQLRETFIDNMMDKGDNDIREEYASYDPRGDIAKDLDTPIRITENNNEYLESMLSTFKDAGINIDPRVLNVVPERNEMIGTRESVLIEKETMESVRDGLDTYKELDNGKYESRTMGEIDKKEAERLNEMFNNLFNIKRSDEMFSKDMNPRDAVELVARGEYLKPVLNPSKYEQQSEVFQKDREIYNKNMDFLRNKLENRFYSSMRRENALLPKADPQYRKADFKDVLDSKNKDLRDYFYQRSEEYRATSFKSAAIRSMERRNLRNDAVRNNVDRQSPMEKRKDIIEKEIKELKQEKFTIDRRLGASLQRIEEARTHHERNLKELEQKRDEQLRGLKDGIFAKIERLRINTEYKYQVNELNNALNDRIMANSNIVGMDYRDAEKRSDEIKNRIDLLNQSIKNINNRQLIEKKKANERYANIEYGKFVRSLINKENTLLTRDYVKPDIESKNLSYNEMKDVMVRDVYDYRTRNLMETKINNKIKAAQERIKIMDDKNKSIQEAKEYAESPDGIIDKHEKDARDFYYEMERSAKDINHFLSLLEEKEPQLAKDLGVEGLRMPENSKDPALYDVLNNTFVKYVDVQIYNTLAYDKLEKLMGIDERYQNNPESVDKNITQEKIDRAIEGWKVTYGYRDLTKDDLKNIYHNPPTQILKEAKMSHDERMRQLEDLKRINEETEMYNNMAFDNSYISEESYNDLYETYDSMYMSPDIIEQLSKAQEKYEQQTAEFEEDKENYLNSF